MNENNIALKEWNVAVNALSQGETILLLRKGGIQESQKSFKIEQKKFWLYPTLEHQKPDLLKENYAKLVTPVKSGFHTETIIIKSQAEVTQSFLIDNPEIIKKLLPYHIWHEKFINERLKFKPKNPLNILLLRVYNLSKPVTIKYNPKYGGCKSWINLLDGIAATNLTPILSDLEYQNRVEKLTAILSFPQPNP